MFNLQSELNSKTTALKANVFKRVSALNKVEITLPSNSVIFAIFGKSTMDAKRNIYVASTNATGIYTSKQLTSFADGIQINISEANEFRIEFVDDSAWIEVMYVIV